MKRPPKRAWLGWTIGLVLACAACAFAFRSLNANHLRHALQHADGFALLVAAPLLGASYLARGFRWRYLFPRDVRSGNFRHATGILVIGFLLNNLLPARGGELVRVVLMGRHNKVPASGTLATLFTERVFDGFVLGCAGLLALSRHIPWLQQLAWLFGVTVQPGG